MKKTSLKINREKHCKTCGELFTASRSTDKWCSYSCVPKDKRNPLQGKSDRNIKPIRKVSAKQQRLNSQYLAARKAFLLMPKNSRCAVYPEKKATEVHHKMGRRGFADDHEIPLITDIRYFLAVSREGHEYIERHPEVAYERGWSLKRTNRG